MNLEWILYTVFHMPCIFHFLTGLYCPGCGGTRSILYLLHGQIGLSLQYHPLVLYGAVIVVLEAGSAVLMKLTKGRISYLGHETLFVYIGIGIVLVNWIVKNVMLVGFGIDLLPVTMG